MSGDSHPREDTNPAEEDDWEKDDIEDSTVKVSGQSDGQASNATTLSSSSNEGSGKEQQNPVVEGSALSPEGPPTGPRIRLMQRPKEAAIATPKPSNATASGEDLWDDDEWDASRAGEPSNRKIWEAANDPGASAMPVVPQNVPALPSSAALRILRRPSPTATGSSPASSGASTPAGSKTSASSQSGQSKTLKTLSEREEEYRRARERIFGLEGEGLDGVGEQQGDAECSGTAASSPNSLTKSLAAPDTPTLPKGSSSTTSSVTSSTSASSVAAPRRQVVQAQPLQNISRSTSANSNTRSNRGGKRNGRGESSFEPLRPPHEQVLYQQQQLQQQHQLYVQQQQYQMQMQLNGYAQSGYVGPGTPYGMNMAMMGMNQPPNHNPYGQAPYQPLSTQGQNVGPPPFYPSRQPQPPMMSPGVVRQPAGPEDLGSLGFADLRIRDPRYPSGTGPSNFGERPNGVRPPSTNQYQNGPPNPSFAPSGRLDGSGQNAPFSTSGMTMNPPFPHGVSGASQYGARPTQQDSSAWPPLTNASNPAANGAMQAGAMPSGLGRNGPQSVWRP